MLFPLLISRGNLTKNPGGSIVATILAIELGIATKTIATIFIFCMYGLHGFPHF